MYTASMMALAVMPFMALPLRAAHAQSPYGAYLLPFKCDGYILRPQRPLSNIHIFLLRKSATYPGIRYNFFIAHRYAFHPKCCGLHLPQ